MVGVRNGCIQTQVIIDNGNDDASTRSVDDKRAFFEHIYAHCGGGGDLVNNSNIINGGSQYSSSISGNGVKKLTMNSVNATTKMTEVPPPPKPKRTFAHDIYMEQKHAIFGGHKATSSTNCTDAVPSGIKKISLTCARSLDVALKMCPNNLSSKTRTQSNAGQSSSIDMNKVKNDINRPKLPLSRQNAIVSGKIAPKPTLPNRKDLFAPIASQLQLLSSATNTNGSGKSKIGTGVKALPTNRCRSAAAEKPPLPPKPPSPFRLKGKPRYFQLSHEYEQLTGDNYSQLSSSSMTSTGDDTSAGLKRWQSDETLYATPIIYADPTTGKQQQQQKQANSPMHGHNNRMAAMIKLAAVERQRIAEETEDENLYDEVPSTLYYASIDVMPSASDNDHQRNTILTPTTNIITYTDEPQPVSSALNNGRVNSNITNETTLADNANTPSWISPLKRGGLFGRPAGIGTRLSPDHNTLDNKPNSIISASNRRKSGDSVIAESSDDEVNSIGSGCIGNQSHDRSEEVNRRANRARLVHRRTLAFYDQQVAAFCRRKAPQLFETALVVQLIERSLATASQLANLAGPTGIDPSTSYIPVVALKYPPIKRYGKNAVVTFANCSTLAADALTPSLFYPDFSKAIVYHADDHWPGDEEFVVTLTNEIGERKFAYCIRYLPRERETTHHQSESLDECDDENYSRCSSIVSTSTTDENVSVGVLPEIIVIISPIQAPCFYLSLAREAVFYAQRNVNELLPRFFSAVFWKPFPRTTESLVVAEIEGSNGHGRRAVIRNGGSLIGRAGSAALVAKMGVENVACILAALLAEHRVLLVGDSIAAVTRAVQTLTSMLSPLSWPHTLIPVVPDQLVDLCHSPTPYFIGILRSNLYRLKELLVEDGSTGAEFINGAPTDDLLIADIDYGVLIPRPSDLQKANESAHWRYSSALMQCDRLGMPRKLAAELMRSLKLAIANGNGPLADTRVEDAVLGWFAALLGHYRHFLTLITKPNEFRSMQLVDAHHSKSARMFLRWFIETGIFQDWIRRKTEAARISGTLCIDAADKRLDTLSASLSICGRNGGGGTDFLSQFMNRCSAAFKSSKLKK